METIKNYLDNLFSNIGVNEDIVKLKANLLNNMEDKYLELKAEGHSENEAIGMVISNFGNIDELLQELGVEKKNSESSKVRIIDQPEAETIIKATKKWGKLIGLGVTLCILAVAFLILTNGILEQYHFPNLEANPNVADIVPLIPLFLFVTIGVGLLIMSGIILSKYEFLEKEEINLTSIANTWVQNKKEARQLSYITGIVLGIMMCIISPLFLIITNSLVPTFLGSTVGVAILLFLVSIAVFLIISSGMEMSTYSKLLKLGDYAPEMKKRSKLVSAVAAIVWPLTTAIYLGWSFLTNDWHITWIVFPIVGILFGAFAGFTETISKNES